jgi:hypothetical protein
MKKKIYDAELARIQNRMGCPESQLRIGTPGFEMGCKSNIMEINYDQGRIKNYF